MIVAMIVMEAQLSLAHSLKDKRQIVSSLKERLHNRFNLSVIESSFQDNWQRVQLGMALIAHDKVVVQNILQEIDHFISANYPFDDFQLSLEYL